MQIDDDRAQCSKDVAQRLAGRRHRGGRSHLGIAIGRAYIRSGARVRFYDTVDLVKRLAAEMRAGRIADDLSRLDRVILALYRHLTGLAGARVLPM